MLTTPISSDSDAPRDVAIPRGATTTMPRSEPKVPSFFTIAEESSDNFRRVGSPVESSVAWFIRGMTHADETSKALGPWGVQDDQSFQLGGRRTLLRSPLIMRKLPPHIISVRRTNLTEQRFSNVFGRISRGFAARQGSLAEGRVHRRGA